MIAKQKSRILIVEDDESMSVLLGRSLEQLGYEVLETVTIGEEAIRAVKELQPDLVLMDIVLDKTMDGIEAAEHIRLFSKVPVVYITGHTDIDKWKRAKITEPFGYILKPFELRELDVVLAAALYKYRKESEIFAMNNRFNSCLQNFRGVVIHSDLDLKPFLVEGPVEDIMGYKPGQIMSGNPRIEALTHPDEIPLYSVEEMQKLRTEPNYGIIKEHRMVTRDNQVLWVKESVRNILDQYGNPASIERVLYDITDHKKSQEDCEGLQKQLLQSEKLACIGQLTAGVAHEINNPVGYISNNMELLKHYVAGYIGVLKMVDTLKKSIEEDNMEKAKSIVRDMFQFEEGIGLDFMMGDSDKLLQHTQTGIDKIQKIIMGLRTFSRSDNEIVELTDVISVLDGVLAIVANEIKYKAEVKKELNEIPLVKANSQELGQVFINLLVNASQAIKDKGEIRIKTYVENNYVKIAISDTGEGISPEGMKKLFTPFFTTKEKGKGTGLGLSISYDIIKRHKGNILVESQVHKGTTFTVLLPI